MRNDNVTAGLKCAPEIGPNIKIKTTRIAPVAMVLPSSAIPSLFGDKVSPMIPEPITQANRKAVPISSPVSLRAKSKCDILLLS